MHDAITILHHSFSTRKLLHILRTSPAYSSPFLELWDHLLKCTVSRISNIDFSHGNSCLQATLPVISGGLGFRVPPSADALLASADGVSDLMQQLLPIHLLFTPYLAMT
jgi:hypothetical protein